MSLPEIIEIVPLDRPVHAEITVPGSKSITNRALVLAALAGGEVTLHGALWSEDTQIMVEALQKLGFDVRVMPEPNEICNRTITVLGLGGKIPNSGTAKKPLELFVGNAGTVARFLAAMVCLGNGVYRLHGVERMHERPQAALLQALRELGYRVEAEHGNEKLPVRILGGGSSRGNEAHTSQEKNRSLLTSAATSDGRRSCKVSIEDSSQFASALLLCAKVGSWKVEVVGENAEEAPYVKMTEEMLKVFPMRGGKIQIEPDASSGSYFWAAGRCILESNTKFESHSSDGTSYVSGVEESCIPSVTVARWPQTGLQIDAAFQKHYVQVIGGAKEFGFIDGEKRLVDEFGSNWREKLEEAWKYLGQPIISRRTDLGDSIMTAIVVAPLGIMLAKFTDLGRLRLQECERVVALRTQLTKCGAKVVEEGDTLTVYPSKLHGAEIETYNDHRMAMCFAILGLKVPGIKIKNPACVKKTFPNFFQKLAAPPPNGLGATMLDGETGRKLAVEELFAA